MAVKIRLKRLGKIRAPYYRIVVADSRTKRDGRVIEEIGKYHPTEEPSFIEVDSERAQYWLSVGAQPTEQVAALLKLTGDWGKFKGDKNAVSTVKVTPSPSPRSRSTPRKKSVVKPKAEKKADEPAAEAPAEADADAADRRRVIRGAGRRARARRQGDRRSPGRRVHRLVDVAARRRPRGARAPR